MAKQTFTPGQVLTAQQMSDLQTNDFNMTVTTGTASYTLQASDKGQRRVQNMAGAGTVTVPDATFDAGDALWLHSIGAGVQTIVAGAGMTLNSSAGTAPTLAQWEGGVVYFTSASSSIFFRGGAGTVLEVEALTVAGGGSGASGTFGGGGGGGGQHRTTQKLTSKGTLGVIVGAGGSGAAGSQNPGNESRFFDIQSSGGINGSGGTGGAGGTGATANGANGGNSNTAGGAGTANDITGTSVTRSGGGGGARSGAGGAGGGGAGASPGGAGNSGTANTGGGGGGSDNGVTAGNGGSGVVIIRYLTADASALTITATNGTSATSGSYTVWTFTSTGVLRIV